MTALYRMIIATGKVTLDAGTNLVDMGRLFCSAVGAFVRPSQGSFASFGSQFSRQMLYTGVEALGLVSIIAFICGSTIILQAMSNMPKIGVSEYFGKILVMAMVRELGPFFTSIVVIGRSGAALAAHIGTMRVNKEVAALEVMGIDPVHFLVQPALLGMMGAMICLNVYFDMIAIGGGLVVANVIAHIPFWIFLSKVLVALSVNEIIVSIGKSVIFGVIIAVVSCHYGLRVTNIRGVPQAAIKSVVGSMAGAIVVNVLVTLGMVLWGFYAL